MVQKSQNLLVRKKGHIVILSLNRPEQANALDQALVKNLRHTFEKIEWDASVNVVILTASGGKSFCAGIDLKERSHMSEDELLLYREKDLIPLFHYLGAFPKPIIGAINGVALGGGAELALICDIRIAVPHARFGHTEIRWGMIPSGGGCQRLRLTAGMSVAKELIFTGKVIEAEEAHRARIYNRVVPSGELIAEALRLGNEIGQHSSLAIKQAKRALEVGAGVSAASAFDFEASKECFYRGQAKEGPKSFKK